MATSALPLTLSVCPHHSLIYSLLCSRLHRRKWTEVPPYRPTVVIHCVHSAYSRLCRLYHNWMFEHSVCFQSGKCRMSSVRLAFQASSLSPLARALFTSVMISQPGVTECTDISNRRQRCCSEYRALSLSAISVVRGTVEQFVMLWFALWSHHNRSVVHFNESIQLPGVLFFSLGGVFCPYKRPLVVQLTAPRN